ncbi:hypothetical protein [Mesorhizobium sp. DCY119]|uniref:hypothetical protein n=1 Tax=Mesorhizobium sp. DCY119 TaxID=2108445 RepID=UPI000E70B6C9|nr:hypothetical protein [Mesorhizobium sp. DCY119]RJG40639.1 hypothetical protein D3Y55_25580 [Mesorhizobium sp. DCY119]
MIPTASAKATLFHHYSCDVWNLPDHPHLTCDPFSDGSLEPYLSSVRPAYNMLLRLAGQVGLLVLISTDRSPRRRAIDQTICDNVKVLFEEAEAELAAVVAPPSAERHHWMLSRTAKLLKAVLARIERTQLIDNTAHETRSATNIIHLLKRVDEMLRLTAAPSAGLSPIDLEQACCNCAHGALSPKCVAI